MSNLHVKAKLCYAVMNVKKSERRREEKRYANVCLEAENISDVFI